MLHVCLVDVSDVLTSMCVSDMCDVQECEDVSYVSSAYIPQCLRYGGRPTLSNAHRHVQ
jgi:hypothetical protein